MYVMRYQIILVILLVATLLTLPTACDRTPTQAVDTGDTSYNHTLGPGAANEDLVTAQEYTRLVVQVHYMEGYAPRQEAIDALQSFLEMWLVKNEVIIRTPEQIPSGGRDRYSASEVRELEEEHRSEFSDLERRTLATYVLILDGEYNEGNVLGIAYYNTSTALFGETIARISGGLGQPSRQLVEATVLRHEFGHLMGLVNAGTDMQKEHQDKPNGAHCDNEECLMYYAFNQADLFRNLFGQQVPDLDAFCEADIRALSGR